MGNYIARGAPAKYAHYGLIEKAPKESNRISCSKCKHYMNDDKSCIKRQLFIPTAGYDQWKYCKYLELIDEMNTQQMRAIVEKVKRSTAQKSEQLRVKVPKVNRIKLKNVMTGIIKEYRLSHTDKGEDVLHPFDGLALKTKQAKTGGSFYWNGNTYRVM